MDDHHCLLQHDVLQLPIQAKKKKIETKIKRIIVNFNNFLLRMILVRFADRGLVVKGKPDLLLFQQLYWIVFGAFFILGILSYPLTQV